MRQVFATSSQSLAESVRIALEAEGIRALLGNTMVVGIPGIPITISVADDAEYEPALAIVRDVARDTPVALVTQGRRRGARLAVVAAVLLLIVFVVNVLRHL